jgi:hypothetical protein
MGGGGGYAGPDLDWGMGPEGSEGTEVSSRSSEDRDFDDVSPLAEKQAFMQAGVPSSPSVLNLQASSIMSGVSVPSLSGMKQFYLNDEIQPTPSQSIGGHQLGLVSNVEGTINQPGGPMSALDLALGVPKNMADEIYRNLEFGHPFLESGVSKEETDRLIDIFAKRNVEGIPTNYSNVPSITTLWEGFPTGSKAPWDKTIQDLNREWLLEENFPGNFLGPPYKKAGWTDTKPMAIWERPLATQQPGYIDPSTYSSVMGGPGQKNSTYGQIREALEKSYQLQKSPSNIENYVGPGQKDALDALPAFDKNKHRLAQLEEEAIKNSGFFRQWNPYSDYSKTGNIYNRSILEANMLADKYANMYGLPKNKQEASMNTYEMSSGVPGQTLPPHANRYTMYDLARHAFLASQTGLIPAQLTENVGSSGQPSDYINNILANKFMRPGGTMTKNLSSLLGTSQIPNKNQKMNEWMQLVYKEMTNPGSTGYNFNFDIYD